MEMKKMLTIGVTVLALGGGVSYVGGITIFGKTDNIINEAPKPISAEEAKKTDLDNEEAGLEAMAQENYMTALTCFMAIADDSETVPHKQDLVSQALNAYLSDIIARADENIDYEDFNKAKNTLEEALRVVPNNKAVEEKYDYVLLREELYYVTIKEDAELVLKYINEHNDKFCNDKFVVELYAGKKAEYWRWKKTDIDEAVQNEDFERAYGLIDEVVKVIGSFNELKDTKEDVKSAEVEGHLKDLKQQEAWREILVYLNKDKKLKTQYSSVYDSALYNYKEDVLGSIDEALDRDDYKSIQKQVVSAFDLLKDEKDFKELYDKYSGYDESKLSFCPVVNNADVEMENVSDIRGNTYNNVICVSSSRYETTIEFRIPEGYRRLQGVVFIGQSDNYRYDENDKGYSIITFYDGSSSIASYDNVTYKQSKTFDVPVDQVEFLTVKVRKTTSGTVRLGIRDAIFVK